MGESIFYDLQRAGLYHAPAARHLRLADAAMRALQTCRTANLSDQRTLTEALQALGEDLGFPDYYGGNLDALYDCLTDPDWQTDRGLVLLINGLNTLRSGDPESFSQLIEVLIHAAESRAESDLRGWIILDTPARGVPKLPAA